MKILRDELLGFDNMCLYPADICTTKIEDVEIDLNRLIIPPNAHFSNADFIKNAIRLGLSFVIDQKNSNTEQKQLLQIALREKTLFDSQSLIWLHATPETCKEIIKKNLDLLKTHKIGIYLDPYPYSGYSEQVGFCLQEIKKYELENTFVGNVFNLAGWCFLEDLGAAFIRIGAGDFIELQEETGISHGQFSTITDIFYSYGLNNAKIVFDDDFIENNGNLIKAFAAGSDYIILRNKMLKDMNQEGSQLERKVQEITKWLKNGISYCGFGSLKEFIGQGTFARIAK